MTEPLKFIVQKVPERNIDHLEERIPGLIVIEDHEHNAMRCFIRNCEGAGPGPWVRLQDDIDLCDGFLEKILAAIAAYPDQVISFFTLRKGNRGDHEVVMMHGRDFLMFQCVYMPAGIAQRLVEFYRAGWPGRSDSPNDDDCLMADFLASAKLNYILWYPNLVQHRIGKSIIDPRRSRFRQSKSFDGETAMTKKQEMVTLPMTEIKPYWRNPRNNRAAVDKVKKSIEDYGYNQPIVVDANHVIIVGHTRYLALTALGWTEAQVIVADLDPRKAKAYRIVDNKTSEYATWTPDLIPELKELGDVGELQFFFQDDLAKMLGVSSGTEHKPVTQEQVEQQAHAAETKFGESHKAAPQAVACPACGHEFSISR